MQKIENNSRIDNNAEDSQLKDLSIMKDKLLSSIKDSDLDSTQINEINNLLVEKNKKLDSNNISFEEYSKGKKILNQTDYEDRIVYEVEDNGQLYYCIELKDAKEIVDLKFSPDNVFSAPAFRTINYYSKVFYINSQGLKVFKNIELDIDSDNVSENNYHLKVFPTDKLKTSNSLTLSQYLHGKEILEKHNFGMIDVYILQDSDKVIGCFVLKDAIQITGVDRIKHYLLTGFRSVYSIESIDNNGIKSIATIQSYPMEEPDELVLFINPKLIK